MTPTVKSVSMEKENPIFNFRYKINRVITVVIILYDKKKMY